MDIQVDLRDGSRPLGSLRSSDKVVVGGIVAIPAGEVYIATDATLSRAGEAADAKAAGDAVAGKQDSLSPAQMAAVNSGITADKVAKIGVFDYGDLDGLPSEFKPAAHEHSVDDVRDLSQALEARVVKVSGKGLSANDYTDAEKTKLAGIQAGAEVNVQADWNATSGDSFIRNKPQTFPATAHRHPQSEIDGLVDGLYGKVDKVAGKGLSTKDFTAAEKTKLEGIEERAQRNVRADWNATTGDSFILNKPLEFHPAAHTHGIGDVYKLQETLATKVTAVAGKGLSTNDFTDALKYKLEHAEGMGGAQADWNATTGPSSILNKPSRFTPAAHTHVQSEVSGLSSALDGKVDKVSGKGLSSNDYTTAEQTKLAGIERGAQKNVQSDWTQTDSSKDGFIQHKPTSFPPATHTHQQSEVSGLQTALSSKVDKVSGKGLSTNDFTDALKGKLDGVQAGAEANVQSDWAETDQTRDGYIRNVPSTFPPAYHTHAIAGVSGLQEALDEKVNAVSGKGLSSNDYTDDDRRKLSGIQANAQVNVQTDWSATSGPSSILNKPQTFTPAAHGHSTTDVTGLDDRIDSKADRAMQVNVGYVAWVGLEVLTLDSGFIRPRSGDINTFKAPSSTTSFSVQMPSYVSCRDEAGNSQRKDAGFVLILDLRLLGEDPTVSWNFGNIAAEFPSGENMASLAPKAGEIWIYSFMERYDGNERIMVVRHDILERGE